MGCGRSKPETKPATAGPAPEPAPGPAPPETATISTTGATTLSLNLTGQGVVLIDTSLVDLGFSTSHPIGTTVAAGTPVVNYLYIRLGVTDIQSPVTGAGVTLKPVLTIYTNEVNPSTGATPVFTLLYENLVVNSFTMTNSFEQTYKVRLPSNTLNKISSIKVKIKWQRPSGGPTSGPIEITEKIQSFDENNIYNFINAATQVDIPLIANDLESFTNYLSIEGYTDDSPLLGKTYARF